MDEDLLDKYFAGLCTPEEAAEVKRRLAEPVAYEHRLLGRSWFYIRQHMRGPIIYRVGWKSLYVAAASVVLLMAGIVTWKFGGRDLVIRNTSNHYEAFETGGVRFRLPPDAAAQVNIGMGVPSADLKFCGDVRIHNTSENDITMSLHLNCAGTGSTILLKARKDKKYLAFPYRFKSEELIIVEEDRVFDLPLPLQQKALDVLKI